MVIPVVKGDFAASFRQREKPANRGAARLSGIGAGRGSDTGAALPKKPASLPTVQHTDIIIRPCPAFHTPDSDKAEEEAGTKYAKRLYNSIFKTATFY